MASPALDGPVEPADRAALADVFALLAAAVSVNIAGVLIAGYRVLARTRLEPADPYRKGGKHWYAGGWSWQSVAAGE